MVYKKTGGRSVITQPVGMPDLSGFFDSANQLAKVSQLASGIGLDIRKREYNDAIRDAEIDGSTAGAVYVDGKLQPLVNFDYEKASGFVPDDRKKILDQYKKSAIRTYASAASVDIDLAADNALLDNPTDPNAIRGSLEGYLEGIEDLDPRLKSSLTAKATQSFGIAENRAFAAQQKEVKANTIAVNSKAYKNLTVEKSKLLAALNPEDQEMQDAVNVRVQEINAEQEQILETLSLNEVSDRAIQKIRDADTTIVASRVGKQLIEKTFYAEGESAARQAVVTLIEEAENNPDINIDLVRSVGVNTLQNLTGIAAAQNKEEKKIREGIYGDFYAKIIMKQFNIQDVIDDPESDFFELLPTQQAQLFSVSQGVQDASEKTAAAYFTKVYEGNVAIIKNAERTGTSGLVGDRVYDAMRENTELFVNGFISVKQFEESKGFFLDQVGLLKVKDATNTIIGLHRELGPNSSFSLSPATFRDIRTIEKYEKIGVIGKNSLFSDRISYIKAVDTYETNYTKKRTSLNLANSAENKLSNNIPVSQKEQSALVEEKGFDKVRIKLVDDSGIESVQMMSVDDALLSEDENVFQQAVDKVANFSVLTNGLLHPSAKQIFERSPFTPENADRGYRIFSQIVTGIQKREDISDRKTAESMFFAQNFSDNGMIPDFFRTVSTFGIELAQESFLGNMKKNLNRAESEIIPKGGNKDDYFDKVFKSSLKNWEFFSIFEHGISSQNKQMLNEMAANAGVSNIEDAFISDPDIRNQVQGLFFNRMVELKGISNPEAVMQDILRDIGKRLGVQQNPRDGSLEFVKDPILKHAQATVPTNRLNGTPVVSINMNTITNDVRDLFLNENSAISSELRKSLMDMGSGTIDFRANERETPTMHFVANETFGAEQTYSVYIRDGYGRGSLLLDNYRYDFKNSQAYKESYLPTLNALNTEKAKQVWSMWGLLDPSLVQASFNSFERTRNDKSLIPLINAYNKLRSNIGSPSDDSLITEEERNDFFKILDTVTSLGFK